MEDNARLMLAGGGDAPDSKPLDELFAAWTGPGGRMLCLPVAMKGSQHPWESCLAWIRSIFTPIGALHIEMWTDLFEHDTEELAAFDSVYLGGGNTFSLLAQLRESGFDKGLVHFARQGGAIYGANAGAMVSGRDIMTCAHLDRNDVGLTETRGLDLVAGHAV
jgi:dipeptidase E